MQKCDAFCFFNYHHSKRTEFIFGPQPIFSVYLSARKVSRTITGLAFPRKSRIQPEIKFETHGANQSPFQVDNGRVIRVRVVDQPAKTAVLLRSRPEWRFARRTSAIYRQKFDTDDVRVNIVILHKLSFARKVSRRITGLAFPRKPRIQPENKFETLGANQSPFQVDNGRVIRVRVVDQPAKRERQNERNKEEQTEKWSIFNPFSQQSSN